MLDSIGEITAASLIALVVIVFLMVTASATSLGRAMLPHAVVNAVAKLVPWGVIMDARATAYGEFHLKVKGANRLKTVHVRRNPEMTIAWTFDPAQPCPQSGTYAFAEFRHNLDAKSDVEPAPNKLQTRIETALAAILAEKQFVLAKASEADVLVSAFATIDDSVAVHELVDGFQHQRNDEWQAAIRTAQRHGGADNPATVASGSIMLYLLDSSSGMFLWRAAAISQFVVEVSDAERGRRTRLAIVEMLRKFPPAVPLISA